MKVTVYGDFHFILLKWAPRDGPLSLGKEWCQAYLYYGGLAWEKR